MFSCARGAKDISRSWNHLGAGANTLPAPKGRQTKASVQRPSIAPSIWTLRLNQPRGSRGSRGRAKLNIPVVPHGPRGLLLLNTQVKNALGRGFPSSPAPAVSPPA